MRERTLIIVKPDGMQRRLEQEIVRRFKKAGLRVVTQKKVTATRQMLRKHYAAHVQKDFYSGLEAYMLECPVLALVLEGDNAIVSARNVLGATDPSKAEKGTIRGDLGDDSRERADREKRSIRNLVHASGSAAEAKAEIRLWFPELKS